MYIDYAIDYTNINWDEILRYRPDLRRKAAQAAQNDMTDDEIEEMLINCIMKGNLER